MPLVSIITPSHNARAFIRDTIDSVLAQTYSNWEMIIVDDCSSDGSVEYIRDLISNDERIKLIDLHTNVGAAMARNTALGVAKGRFVAFLDSDDMWAPEKLDVQVNFMLQSKCAFSYTAYNVCNDKGDQIFGEISVPDTLTYHQYLANTIIGCLTVMLDVEKLGKIQMPNLRSSHDMALWADILKSIDKAYGINTSLASYRLVATSNTANKLKASKEVWAVYRKHLNMNVFSSLFYFVQYAFNAIKKRMYK